MPYGFDPVNNFGITTVITPPSPALSGTVIELAEANGPGFPCPAVVWPADTQPLASNAEVVTVESLVSGTTFNILRQQEGSSARAIQAGDQFAANITAKTLTDIQGAFGGLWKNYGDEGGITNPFTGVTIGNGTLVARYWKPAPVPIAFATPPFLCFIYVALKFGSTTSVDGPIIFQEPTGLDAAFEIDPYLAPSDSGSPDNFMSACPTLAQAFIAGTPSGRSYPGVGVTPTDGTQFVTVGTDPIAGSAWDVGVPDTWTEGSLLAVQRTYLGAFYGA